ncbi:MAG: prepilin-type N-terminal cleavage/methylation domain-containing protein [Burkholderiales bacterium]|nr:prepilin-type N-terminal cleavage/methylation domain-containing protein [Burkholderiales bacterium]
MQYRLRSRQTGFTLVEIAIVLVIIGLLLGGVLKGQELIENSRIKSIVNDMKAIQAAYNGYIDRYKALPGDETAATMTARGWTGTAGATVAGNGVLAINVNQTFNNGGDQSAFWRALRGSGLISGDPAAPATVLGLPTHGGGGLLGVTAGPAYGSAGPLICASGLTTKQAAGIDGLVDGAGAANNTGSLLGAQGAANPLAPVAVAPPVTAYNETTPNRWTVCMRL